MATAILDGITTRYELIGAGAPLLMFSPGGFDATLEKWRTQGVYSRIKLLDHLSKTYTCIVFDRRETGQSGGRVERITWMHYATQGKALLDHLDIQRAHIIGACMGCCPAAAFAVAHPETTQSVILYWPVGGARYRINSHLRFAQHLAYVQEHGLDGVAALAAGGDKSFSADPRGGPWVSVLRRDAAFAAAYGCLDVEHYKLLIAGMVRALFDRDTAPGAEPEDLLRLPVPALVVPGGDETHAVSAARYLAECLPGAEYWDAPVSDQTEQTAPVRLLKFLESVGGR